MADVTDGMNIGEVRLLARELGQVATEIDVMVKEIGGRVATTTWVGKDCRVFTTQWWPRHQVGLRRLADDLRGFGQSASGNADDQERASGSGGQGLGKSHEVSTTSYDRKVYSGVAGRGVDGSSIDVVRMSDGTYRVRVAFSSAFEANFGDVLKLASLGRPDLAALANVAGMAGGSVEMFGVEQGWELWAPDEASAHRLAEGLKREASELGGLDGLNRSEIQQVLDEEVRRGTTVGVSGSWIESPGATVTGSIGDGLFSLEGSRSANTLIHSVVGNESAGDTLRSIGMVDAEVGNGTVTSAVSKEITVVRNIDGAVIGLDVRSTISPTIGIGVSSSDYVDALTAGSKNLVPGMPGYDNITGFLNSEVKMSTGVVSQTTTSYDLTSPEGRAIAELFGSSNPNDRLSADEILRMSEQIAGGGTGGTRTIEIYDVGQVESGGRYVSYESRTTEGSASLIGRSVDTF